ncbi:hypothetical protein B0A55_02714 [Friedmanniomyces simplex]|uniref:Uncharacterized protein n=1 Tax=Friedmanniomyces simplex TaxID=329884 RepID=A0A4U0XRU4_9PEZI|nr:hypothetical protein B0A55_02714 [Friedmanniomyces simplex]
MAVIGWNTSNGKAYRQKPDPEKAKLERQEAKRDAKLEREKSRRLAKSAPRYTNSHLWIHTVETPIVQRDRYAFGGPMNVRMPHPKNIVFTAARAVLQEYNQADLHRTIDPLAVEALSAAPTICRALDTEPEVFLLVRAQTFIKLQLKLVRESTAPGAASIAMVRVGSRRYSLRAWLETLPEHRMPDLDRLALELQYKQWRESELRKRILLFAVGPYVEPRYTTEIFELNGRPLTKTMINVTGNGIPKEAEEDWYIEAQPKRLEPVNFGLLELSKATREDAIDVLWKDTTKRYRSADLLLRIPAHIPALYHGYIRRLELALTHVDFIITFRCQIKPAFICDRALATAPAHVLSKANLPLLKYLQLAFMSTVELAYSPWAHYIGGRYFNIDFDRLPCQKTLIDWMMCFVLEWVEHIPVIELSGFIKTQTKAKWERVLNSKRPRDWEEYIESERRSFLTLPDYEFPPHCFCPHPCGFVDLAKIREQFNNSHRCGHRFRDRCRCIANAPKPHHITRAARNYFFDYNDSFKIEQGMDNGHDGVEREEWMRIAPR